MIFFAIYCTCLLLRSMYSFESIVCNENHNHPHHLNSHEGKSKENCSGSQQSRVTEEGAYRRLLVFSRQLHESCPVAHARRTQACRVARLHGPSAHAGLHTRPVVEVHSVNRVRETKRDYRLDSPPPRECVHAPVCKLALRVHRAQTAIRPTYNMFMYRRQH